MPQRHKSQRSCSSPCRVSRGHSGIENREAPAPCGCALRNARPSQQLRQGEERDWRLTCGHILSAPCHIPCPAARGLGPGGGAKVGYLICHGDLIQLVPLCVRGALRTAWHIVGLPK